MGMIMNRKLSKDQCESNYKHKYQAIPAGLGATRASLMRLLRSIDLVGWSSHEESGRLDRKALTRFATGSTTVFNRRQSHEAERSAVSILVDCSGSMNYQGGDRIDTAESVAIQLSRILDSANVSFAVTGFSGSETSLRRHRTGANTDQKLLTQETLNWIPFKEWGESIRKAAPKLGSMSEWVGSSTPDFSALSAAIDDVVRQPETRKVVFMITDADSAIKSQMQYLENSAKKQGVVVVVIGIHCDEIADIFENAATVTDVSDLSSTAFNTLLKTLKG
jgi:cobalamin biosynthesis protein CobT